MQKAKAKAEAKADEVEAEAEAEARQAVGPFSSSESYIFRRWKRSAESHMVCGCNNFSLSDNKDSSSSITCFLARRVVHMMLVHSACPSS